MVFIHSVEEVKRGYYHYGRPLIFLILITYTLLSTAYKFVAQVTKYSPASLEYKIHNLSLKSESRQNLQLDPQFIPSIRVETRLSYQFRLPAHYTIL